MRSSGSSTFRASATPRRTSRRPPPESTKSGKHHEERYRKLLANIESGEVWERVGPNRWQCRNCGAIVEGEKAPEVCPVCFHKKAYFQLEAENY